ncbi:MAG TPA: GNAT family N-acetyltransferase [Intrasporangium sp.]|nr:GNAT family N-acetyltransferase [Intrasporangium sp.]
MPLPQLEVVPTLSDGVVTLRAHRLEDVDAILEQCTDPETLRWTTVPRGYTRDDAVAFVQRIGEEWSTPDGNRYWAIEFNGDGEPRFGGTIDLRPGPSPRTASVGFGLHPAARGRGVMSRAVRLAARHGFTEGLWGPPLERIHWRAIAGNWGSRRVAWATGFTFHATIPAVHVDPTDPEGPALDCWYGSLGAGEAMRPVDPWLTPVPLEGTGIRLREWRESDGDAIEDRSGDPAHWMPPAAVLRRETFPLSLMARRMRMAAGLAVHWCIADASTDLALGDVLLFSRGGPLTGDTAELGYQLNPSARGRGVAREAARLVVDVAGRPRAEGGLGMRRLVAETAVDNAASNRVLESLGFTIYGREHAVDLLDDGSYGDGLHWELLLGS